MKMNLRTTILTGLAAVGLAIVLPAVASAALSGVCSSCHTMHNSQNGTAAVNTGTTTVQNLLKFNCIGCHADGTTLNAAAGTQVPQVGGGAGDGTPGGGTLAAGYFNETNTYMGHNVSGLNDGSVDPLGNTPPGGTALAGMLSCDGTNGCHKVDGQHHTNTNGSYVGSAYRFLSGSKTVAGYESANWEFDTSTSHNRYQYGTNTDSIVDIDHLCAECHPNFHTAQGSSGAWTRHPTDISVTALSGEYASYNWTASNNAYSTEAPVGTDDADGTGGYTDANLKTTDTYVMCLSCHRAHGSANADMLRWSYTAMNAGNGGAAADTGCFTCHTTKD